MPEKGMDLAASLGTRLLTGKALTVDGKPYKGSMKFTNLYVSTDNPDNAMIAPSSAYAAIDETTGEFAIRLPVTSDTDLSVPLAIRIDFPWDISNRTGTYYIIQVPADTNDAPLLIKDLIALVVPANQYVGTSQILQGLAIGDVTALPYGAQPVASITGALPVPKLNLGLVTGPRPEIQKGTVTKIAPGGQPTVGWRGDGSSQSPYMLDIGLVTGDTGDPGTPASPTQRGIIRLAGDLAGTADAPTVVGKANAVHTHAATDITSGLLPLARGGTNAADATTARSNLGVPSNPAASTAGMRTLGTGATEAAAGNHQHIKYGYYTQSISRQPNQVPIGSWSLNAGARQGNPGTIPLPDVTLNPAYAGSILINEGGVYSIIFRNQWSQNPTGDSWAEVYIVSASAIQAARAAGRITYPGDADFAPHCNTTGDKGRNLTSIGGLYIPAGSYLDFNLYYSSTTTPLTANLQLALAKIG